MSMLENGAQGNSRAELARALGFPDGINPSDLNSYNSAVVKKICSTQAKVALANKAWVKPPYKVRQKFMDELTEFYNAEFDVLDASTIQSEFNSWCEKNTFGLIKEFKLDDVSTLDYLLANATYYKNRWFAPYETSATQVLPFNNADGTQTKVEMMRQAGLFDYAADSKCSLCKQYMGEYGEFAFFTVLPEAGVGTDACVDYLVSGGWDALYNEATHKNVYIYMPKFDIAGEVKMNDVLKSLGFSMAGANLNKMFAGAYGKAMKQKTRCVVNEYGVEAAAVTAAVAAGCDGPIKYIEHCLDRPFIYGIVHESTGTILFLGVAANLPNTTSTGDSKR